MLRCLLATVHQKAKLNMFEFLNNIGFNIFYLLNLRLGIRKFYIYIQINE